MSFMTTFSAIKLNCPICEETFSSGRIGSCGYASKRTDFRPNYWGMNPVTYFYHLCPHCGFSASESYFGQKITNSELVMMVKELGPLNENKLSSKLERAMICLEIMNATEFLSLNSYELACYWLEPYWWAENEEDIKKFGKVVINYLTKAFKENSVPEEQIHNFQYLIGEIYRRIGETEKAHEFFDIVLSELKEDKNNTIYKLAFQQKTAPEEDFSSSSVILL